MKFPSLFRRRKQREQELEEEIRGHLAMAIRERMEQGEDRAEAEANARREFGNATLVKEVTREMWGWSWLETFLQDLRYGLRQLRRHPGFTAVATITLALGIGANTAVFSVANAVLFRPLPYRNPSRLLSVWQTYRDFKRVWVSTPDLYDWRGRNTVFDQIAAYRVAEGFNLAGPIEPRWVEGTFVTANLFPMLGVHPSLGRGFFASEDQPGAPPEVILSHSIWTESFHSRRKMIGSVISLDGKGYTVVGVMPSGFDYPSWAALWLPLGQMGNGELTSRVYHPLDVVARLNRGMTLQQAQSEMSTIAGRLALEYPKTNGGWGVRLISLRNELLGNLQRALLVLLVSTVFVLLIACANIANLLLARAGGRQGEMAVRAALGASHRRLTGQLLSESMLLALLGCGAGLVLARWGLTLMVALGRNAIPRFQKAELDGRVLAFALLITLLTGILFGLIPALRTSNLRMSSTLRAGVRVTPSELRPGSAGSFLVVSEVALALVVLVGSGLLLRSFTRILRVNPGFDPSHLLTARLSLLDRKYSKAGQQNAFYTQLLQNVKALPGVEGVGLINELPLKPESAYKTRFAIEGRVLPAGATFPVAELRLMYPGYFAVMRIPLVRGRFFNNSDFDSSSVLPVIVNQYLVNRFFGKGDPIGERIDAGPEGRKPSWVRIVGVVGDTKESGLTGQPRFELYFCASNPEMYLVVRTASDPLSLVGAIQGKVRKLDETVPISDVLTMEERLSLSLAERRFSLALLGTFGCLGLALALCGIYAVISYSVERRTHEIGIRVALGAQRTDVLRLVVGQGMVVVFVGMGAGLVIAWGLTRFMASQLYGIGATDPITFLAVSLILSSVALIACYVPARRAANADPMTALRHE
jgi:putative ABC transport system permease protein